MTKLANGSWNALAYGSTLLSGSRI